MILLDWLVHVQEVQLGGLFICLLCYRGCWPVASVTVLTVASALHDTVRLRVGRHTLCSIVLSRRLLCRSCSIMRQLFTVTSTVTQ